jgi:predicted adenine nucleotide alpha hydrolase (AANH) superfamily ATPase
MEKAEHGSLLLHVCCAPCSTHVIDKLQSEYDITCYFYNPNVHPRDEYMIRLKEAERYAKKMHIRFIEGPYDSERWFSLTEEYKDEREGGKRCELCYKIRLEKTAEYASEHGFECFGATLSISPHKKAAVINRIGNEIALKFGVKFLEANFKKQDGFKKSVEMSKAENMYRQDYCGCIYSKQERDAGHGS